MKTKYSAILLLVGAIGAIVAGCGTDTTGGDTSGPQGCTLIGCASSFQVEFVRPSWPAGSVEIVVTADGTTTTCTVTLPYASCDNVVQCDKPNPDFIVEASGCALPAAQHSITGVAWPTTNPKDVTITVNQDGMMLGMQTFAPTYEMSRPNGPDCEPVCNQATMPASMTF
jgi:hypothetical protein